MHKNVRASKLQAKRRITRTKQGKSYTQTWRSRATEKMKIDIYETAQKKKSWIKRKRSGDSWS